MEAQPDGILRGVAAVWMAFEAWPYERDIHEHLVAFEKYLLRLEAEVSGAKDVLLRFGAMQKQNERLTMHPIRLETCLSVLRQRKAITTLLMTALIQKYAQIGELSHVDALFRVAHRNGFVSDDIKPDLARFAERMLQNSMAPARRAAPLFERALYLLADTGHSENPIMMLARALCYGISRPMDTWSFEQWEPPAWYADNAKRQRVRSDSRVASLVRAFVRYRFPTLWGHDGSGASALVEFLYALADVSAEFDALLENIDDLHGIAVDIVALGAANSTNADVETLLQRAFAMVRGAEAWWESFFPMDEDS